MSDKDVVMIGPDQDVEEAGGCWLSTQLDRLLVIEESDRLVGIVSEADLRRDEGLLAEPTIQRRVIHKW